MRSSAIALVAFCLAGAALAQSPPTLFTPDFEAEPSPQQLVRHYPQRALRQNISGIAVLCCTPRPDRSLDCVAHSEWPAGQGFGAASVSAAQGYRLPPDSYADTQARRGISVRVSLMWAGSVASADTIATLQQMDRDSMYACHQADTQASPGQSPTP